MGATMISISCDHPDLEDFINLKTDLDVCTKANISVRVTDDFMKAVIEDKDWKLSFTRPETGEIIEKTVKAQEIFKLLAKRNWEMGEPGILFWDRISNYNLLQNTGFKYSGLNPCAEEPLPAGGSCLLGSINLSHFVDNPFTEKSSFNYSELAKCVHRSVRALNKVLIEGLPLHPLEEQRISVSKWRQIGLGTMSLGDTMIMLGLEYGSSESLVEIEKIYKLILTEAIKESLQLAKEKGCYEECNKEKLVESDIVKNLNLDLDIIEDIKKYGLYNSQLLTCAPCGSISTYWMLSSGIEPHYSLKPYKRRTVSLNKEETTYDVYPHIVEEYRKVNNPIGNLPSYFVDSADLKPINRIKVQAMLQKYIDASISSTVNLPEKTTVDDIYNIYVEAWKHGLKGITIWRDNCNRQAILTTGSEAKQTPSQLNISVSNAPKRPKELEADYYQVKANKENFVVIVGLLDSRPYEVFAWKPDPSAILKLPKHKGKITKNSKKHYKFESDLITIPDIQIKNESLEEKTATLYISQLLRHGVLPKYIIKTMKKVDDNITSFTAAVTRILSKYEPKEELEGEVCPECGGKLLKEAGCVHCIGKFDEEGNQTQESCGFSRCGD